MSSHDEVVYLKHMLDYAGEAHQLADGRSRADLDGDRLFMLATTRLLEMMGEAATRLSAETRAQTLTSHGKKSSDCGTTWSMVTTR